MHDATAFARPLVLGLDGAAGQHRTFGFQALPDHDEAEFVEAAKHGQARAVSPMRR